MIVRGNYTRLSKPLYLFGVPTKFFVLEIAVAVIGIILMRKWIIAPLIAVIHFALMLAYKKSHTWRQELMFYLGIPFRRMYQGKVAYLPKSDDKLN